MDQKLVMELRQLAANIRIETLYSIASFGSGHVGGSMSIADTLAVLYGAVLSYDPQNPQWKDRDRVVMSKGHCGPALYSALALSGFFPKEWLSTLNRPGTRLPSHCDRLKTPGIDVSTGSLGQGASLGCGLALALKKKNSKSMVYTILGDGELQEGEVWEAFLFANAQRLNNLVFLIDRNHMQLDGFTEGITPIEPLQEKCASFGMKAAVINGHSVEELYQTLKPLKTEFSGPYAIILDTIKGGGYYLAEKAVKCHHMPVSPEDAEAGKKEILRRLENNLPVCGETRYD